MNTKGFVVIGILFVSAIFVILTTKNNPGIEQEFLQTPTPTVMPLNIPTSSILGEEAEVNSDLQSEDTNFSKASNAVITTTKGDIEIVLFPEAAPNTVLNFATKSRSGFYDNLTFHRVENWVVQGGDPAGNGSGGGQMTTELNNNPFIRGSVGIARKGDINISNDSQFFITKTDASHLDGQYTNFGQVSSGLEIVDSLQIGDKIISISIN